jgi:predicted glycogen debranching enzyme
VTTFNLQSLAIGLTQEWLEADGLGGFASGTAAGIRTRRYHALLLTATTPPTGRMVLVNGFDAWLVTPERRTPLTSQRYAPGIIHPDGSSRIAGFSPEPWPTWEFEVEGARLRQEIVVENGTGVVVVSFRVVAGELPSNASIEVRLFMSGRDYHSMHHENGAFGFAPEERGAELCWRAYPGVPEIRVLTNGTYIHAPEWYRQFLYEAERARGLDDTEDLASPGIIRCALATDGRPAVLVLSSGESAPWAEEPEEVVRIGEGIRSSEAARRQAFETPLHRAADAYVVRRGEGNTIVAGYPWFTDWGRDTFIALRGLSLATGRLEVARDILVQWAEVVSEGMLPNRFPDGGEAPEYNSVDAALWYVITVGELLELAKTRRRLLTRAVSARMRDAVQQILAGYMAGTRFGIRMDDDGLLAAGAPGVQLTWMDAKVGDRVITPRIGKPVEIQALWLNALAVGANDDQHWTSQLELGLGSFEQRFWNASTGHLNDVVDVDHEGGTLDPSCRPNQILAVGGLPMALLDDIRARSVVDVVERRLLTPLGLRSLAPGEPGYAAHYRGGPVERDSVYHQGTVWPWLLGPFVDAWLQVRRNSAAARREAAQRFLAPLEDHLEAAGLGHVSEVADAEAPFTPGGCPFQAWSLGELLRIRQMVVGKGIPSRHRRYSAAL